MEFLCEFNSLGFAGIHIWEYFPTCAGFCTVATCNDATKLARCFSNCCHTPSSRWAKMSRCWAICSAISIRFIWQGHSQSVGLFCAWGDGVTKKPGWQVDRAAPQTAHKSAGYRDDSKIRIYAWSKIEIAVNSKITGNKTWQL